MLLAALAPVANVVALASEESLASGVVAVVAKPSELNWVGEDEKDAEDDVVEKGEMAVLL